MTTLQIEHAVTDFVAWKQAFDRFADLRATAGVRRHVIRRPIDDAAYVVIDLEFDDQQAAAAFLDILRTRIWATPGNSPALAGAPSTRLLERVGQSAGTYPDRA